MNRQGRSGDGLYKKRGFWYFRVVDWAGRRRFVATRTKSYEAAKAIRAERLREIDEGASVEGSARIPLRVLAQRWLERRSLDASDATKRNYAARLKHINAILGDLPLGKINGDILRRYQIERKGQSSAPKSINLETEAITSILKENRCWSRIRDDFRPLREPETRGRRLTADELERLMKVAESRSDISVIFLVMRLALETGLRHKEIRTLHVADVDMTRGLVRIRRSGTKTDAGAREVPLTGAAREIVADLLERARDAGADAPEHYLFPATRIIKGHRVLVPDIPRLSFGDAWRTLRRLAKVDGTLRIHDLRHHVATDMAEAGVPGAVAMRLMGWASPRVRKRYEHIQDAALADGMRRLTEHRDRQEIAPPPKPPTSAPLRFEVIRGGRAG